MSLASRKGIGGPQTPLGKRIASLNALKHGLCAESEQAMEAIAQVIGKTYDQVLAEMRDCYKPTDAVEEMLVRRVARCTWRMMLTEAMEDRAFARQVFAPSPGTTRERIIRYERLTDIQLHRAIEALERRRTANKVIPQNELPQPETQA